MKVSRLNSIEQYILQHGSATIDELVTIFGVSKNTIRRDLNALEERGYIAKVYGGVTSVRPQDIIPIPERFSENLGAKRTIGKLAANFVNDGDNIYIDSGSTALNIIQNITGKSNITIITNCLSVMVETTKHGNFNLISPGGFYSEPTGSFVGISAFEALSSIRVNKAFMAATGISLNAGLTNNSFFEAEMKREVVAHSGSVFLLADHTKIGREAAISFCPISRITAFITDLTPPAEYVDYFRDHGIELVYDSASNNLG